MKVSTMTSVATGLTRSANISNTNSAASLRAVPVASRDTSAVVLTPAPTVANASGALKVAAQNIAQAGVQVDVADLSAGQIAALLSQIQALTTRASSATLSNVERNLLNAEFQSLRLQINVISSGSAASNSISPTPLQLQYAGLTSNDVAGIDLSSAAIFSNAEVLDILTPQSAQASGAVVASALDYVRAQQAVLASVSAGVELAAATVESAMQNIQASVSVLTPADLAAATSANESVLVKLQQQAAEAAAAQTKLLPADILKLLGD